MLDGAKIRRIRERAGLSPPEPASKTGVDARTIRLAEGGKRLPRFSTLRLLAGGLECTVADFFDDAKPNPSERVRTTDDYDDERWTNSSRNKPGERPSRAV